MDLEDSGSPARFPIRDRDEKYPALFGDIPTDAGIKVVLSGVRIPRMIAIRESRVRDRRRELLDRTLIWSQQHLTEASCCPTCRQGSGHTARHTGYPCPRRRGLGGDPRGREVLGEAAVESSPVMIVTS